MIKRQLLFMKRVADFNKIMYLMQMLMDGKEAGNRKQEIDRQRRTIPNPKTKSKRQTLYQCA